MPKLSELLQEGTPLRLWHPVIGYVKWETEPCVGWALRFANGPDRNDYLYVDIDVLNCDRWKIYEEPWKDKLGRVADQCVVCGTKDEKFGLSSHPNRCLSCMGKTKRNSKKLMIRLAKLTEEAQKKWCDENNLNYELEKEIFS